MLGFDPWERGPGAPISLDSLVGGRLDRAAVGGWRIVGLAITPEDLRDGTPLLLDGLVTGDVVIAGPGAKTVLVHCGDRFADAGSGRRGIARPV